MTRSLFVVEGEGWDPICARRSRDEAEVSARYQSATQDPLVVEYVPRPRWIPVAERLPEPCEPVLVRNVADFIGDDVWTGDEWVDTINVTHWMPLPEGPAE